MIPALVDFLATYYQAGNLDQVEAIARSMLAAIPDDTVSLQFLGLALYQTGRINDAYQAFKQAAARLRDPLAAKPAGVTCESAASVSMRMATRPHSGLAAGWWQIARIMNGYGFRSAAHRACNAALRSQGHGSACAAPGTASLSTPAATRRQPA